jgi:hypothetical protein
MLAMADRHGRVWASIPGLAKEAAVSVEACRTAVAEFLAPDPDSRTKINEGRRIEPIDGGWRLINHAKYRAIRDQEERRAYKAEKQREYRAVDKVDKSGHRGPEVERCAHNAEADAEAEQNKTKTPPKGKPSTFTLPAWINQSTWNDFEEMRRKIRAPLTDRARHGIIKDLEKIRNHGGDPEPVLEQSITRAWRGVFPLNGENRPNGGFNGNGNRTQQGKGYSIIEAARSAIADLAGEGTLDFSDGETGGSGRPDSQVLRGQP